MKDAKGHGSDSRGGASGVGEVQQAAQNFVAAHQQGVNEAAPSLTGRALYESISGRGDSGYQHGYDANTLRDMAPDWDEYGDFKHESPNSGRVVKD